MNLSETKRESIVQWASAVNVSENLLQLGENPDGLSLDSKVSRTRASSLRSPRSLVQRSVPLKIGEDKTGPSHDYGNDGLGNEPLGLDSDLHNIGRVTTDESKHDRDQAAIPTLLVQQVTESLNDYSSETNSSLGLGSDLPEIESSSQEEDHIFRASKETQSRDHEHTNLDDAGDINDSLGLGSDLPEIESSSEEENHRLRVPKSATSRDHDATGLDDSYDIGDSLGLGSDLPEIESSSEEEAGRVGDLVEETPSFHGTSPAGVYNDSLMNPESNDLEFPASILSRRSTKSASSFCPESIGRREEVSINIRHTPNRELEQLSPHILEKAALLGDPWYWGEAWKCIRSLNKELSISFETLDLYLLSCWHDLRESSLGVFPNCYYIDERTARRICRNTQIGLRERLLIKTDGPLQKFPVLAMLRESETNYVAPSLLLLNYDLNQILVLGQSQVAEHEEMYYMPEWMHNLWKNIGDSFKWISTQTPKMIKMNWIPRHKFIESVASVFDSIAGQEWVWSKGMYHVGTPPVIQCPHSTRQRIFAQVLSKCTQYAQYWTMLRGSQDEWISPQQDLLADLEIGFTNFSSLQHSSIRLLNAMRSCSQCCPNEISSVAEAGKKKASSSGGSFSSDKSEDGHQNYYVQRKSRQQPNPFAIPSGHFGTTEGGSNPPVSLDTYDDYSSAPMETRGPDRIPGIWTFQNGQSVLPSCWTDWKDRGYRLHKNSFNTVTVRKPASHRDRFLPFVNNGAKSDANDNFVKERADDCLNLSAQQMLDEAGMFPGTTESVRVFVKGVERSRGGREKYIKLDLTADEVSISDDQVDISVDLDSMMWLTGADSFRIQSLELRQTPSTSQKAAFSVNNFVYVNLVCPPTTPNEVEDAEERTRANFKLSRIPHMELGHSGEGDRRVNIYVFFPRMIKQDSDTGRYSTLIPRPVQELWLDNVILASCQQVFEQGVGFSEYLSSTVKTIQDRSGDRRKQKSMTIYGKNTARLLQKMSIMVKESAELLGCFGSFFLVADARGMKLATKQCIDGNLLRAQSYIADFAAIKLQFGDLHWDYMLDRNNGELYLDLGVSFHPRNKEPVVGLWKLPKLRDSYDLMDMKAGTVHHFSTLGAYGGLKSESKHKMHQISQLVSRLSYCLVFEMVRNPGAEEYLCSDKDIAECGPKFTAACKRWTDLFEMGENRSFGVREEIRGIGATIVDLLDVSLEKARAYLSSRPIMWIRSCTFFKFLARRLTEVRNLQVSCYKMRIPNYCLLSVINGYLLRHVMVTPFVKNRYLVEALRELRSREIMATFGAFFLHTLDISRLVLPDISQEDTDEMRKMLGDPMARFNNQRESELPPPLALTLERRGVEYPWGEHVTMKRLKDLLETIPEEFLKVTQSDDLSLKSSHSEKLFVSFSQQIWISLSVQAVGQYPPNPQTLEQALKMWTVHELKDYCKSIELVPCTYGLDGLRSRAAISQISFRERRLIFFPSPDDYRNYSSHWEPFKNNETGYINMYHDILNHFTQEERDDLNADLDNIFSRLQCLPPSSGDMKKGTVWTSHQGRLQFVTNPKCYPIKGIEKDAPKDQTMHRFQLSKAIVNKLFHEKIYGAGSYRNPRNRKSKPLRKKRSTKRAKTKKATKQKKGTLPTIMDVSDTVSSHWDVSSSRSEFSRSSLGSNS